MESPELSVPMCTLFAPSGIIIQLFYWLLGKCVTVTITSWSRSGHHILSASTDNTVAIWEVLSGECTQRYRFPSPIIKVQFHPRQSDKFLVSPMRHAAVLVEVEGSHKLLPLDEEEVEH